MAGGIKLGIPIAVRAEGIDKDDFKRTYRREGFNATARKFDISSTVMANLLNYWGIKHVGRVAKPGVKVVRKPRAQNGATADGAAQGMAPPSKPEAKAMTPSLADALAAELAPMVSPLVLAELTPKVFDMVLDGLIAAFTLIKQEGSTRD